MRSARRITAVVFVLAGVACLAVLWIGGGAAAEPSPAGVANAVGAPITWRACGPPASLQWVTIRVPLDWDRPAGRTIKPALIRNLASKPDQRTGTLFINPGGPGDTGVGLVSGDPEGTDAFAGGRLLDER